MKPSEQDWLTTAEVALVIRETRANVSRRCKRGEFPGAVQIGRNWRIPQEGVDSFLTPKPARDEAIEQVFRSPAHKRAVLAGEIVPTWITTRHAKRVRAPEANQQFITADHKRRTQRGGGGLQT